MNKLLADLYYGRISGWERRPVYTSDDVALRHKIDDERQYFTEQMSSDDKKRYDKYESLRSKASDFVEEDAFSYGFRLGVKLMCAVFSEDGGPEPSNE